VLQDKTGKDATTLKAMSDKVIGQIMQQPGVQFAYTTFRTDFPQLEMEVDTDKAKQMGVSVSSMMSTIQTYFSGDQSLNFTRFGKFYRVNVKADGVFRMDQEAFNEIFVRNDQNQMVPVKTLIKLHKVYGPESVDRYNLFNALNITVVAVPGVSNGDMMENLEKNVFEKLPSDYGYEWTGLSLEEKSAGNQTMFILALFPSCGTVRELFIAAFGTAFHPDRYGRFFRRHKGHRIRQQYLCTGRADHACRSAGKKCYPDRRVCRSATRSGTFHRGIRRGRSQVASASHYHDLARFYRGYDPADGSPGRFGVG
jgi:hypothetical protein